MVAEFAADQKAHHQQGEVGDEPKAVRQCLRNQVKGGRSSDHAQEKQKADPGEDGALRDCRGEQRQQQNDPQADQQSGQRLFSGFNIVKKKRKLTID